jgi:predicted HicB family RNase H-like nuclease
MMSYKGYTAFVEFDTEAKIFHGEVADLSDVVTFQNTDAEQLEEEFHQSVDVYLTFCQETGRQPEKPFSGKFIVRIPKQLHQKAFLTAQHRKQSLNSFIARAIEKEVHALSE